MGDAAGLDEPGVPEPPIVHSHLAYFFVPLPDPMGLPDHHTMSVVDPVVARGSRQEADDGPPPPPFHLAASLMFHRTSRPSPNAQAVAELFRLASAVMPTAVEPEPTDGERDGTTSHAEGPSVSEEDAPHPVRDGTVVEMAVLCDLPAGPEEPWQDLSEAFDRGLARLREVQRAYFIATRRPSRLVSRESLPSVVPYAVRPLFDDDGKPAPFEVRLGAFVVSPTLMREIRVDDDEDGPPGFAAALHSQGNRGVFTGYLDFRREADVAMTFEGSYRTAVLFAATACEIVLDDLLAHMLWEEKVRPEDAAGTLDGSPLGSRVKKHYHQRLGGQWATDGTGPIAAWYRDVAGLRNRVVHAGYEPDLAQAAAAFDAVARLEAYLGDLLAERASRYPRTAMVLPGEHGLRRRGRWSKRLERIQDDPAEVPWQEAFARWRDSMRRSQPDAPDGARPDPTRAAVLVVVRTDGTPRWVAHDADAGMAATVSRDDVRGLDGRGDTVDRLLRQLADDPPDTPLTISLAGAAADVTAAAWQADYRLVPGLGVMVNGQDLDP